MRPAPRTVRRPAARAECCDVGSCGPSAGPGVSEACCAPITRAPLSAGDAKTLAASLRVLGDPARLRLVSLLEAHPGGEACVCNLIEPLRLSQPTVTHHLQVLHRAGFLTRERRGVWVYYRVVPRALAAVRKALG